MRPIDEAAGLRLADDAGLLGEQRGQGIALALCRPNLRHYREYVRHRRVSFPWVFQAVGILRDERPLRPGGKAGPCEIGSGEILRAHEGGGLVDRGDATVVEEHASV